MSVKPEQKKKKTGSLGLAGLVIGALGVVYGDIGTSPLYAVTQMFFGHGHIAMERVNILGAISLIIWVLTLVVTLKYVSFVLLASREGEGGVFALLGILSEFAKKRGIILLTAMLVLAAGLLFGDGLITPAISILSAVEGLSVATSTFNPYIIPITLAILACLFSFQYKGTGKVGAVFGPIMVVWFTVIAVLGLRQIIGNPGILAAVNPVYAFIFFRHIGFTGVLIMLGAVVLAVTGGEALYADLGHFGLSPIRISWLSFVYPALILNYLGQGAFLLSGSPIAHDNIFFSLVPTTLIYPMVFLAACATIIASQALISGAFSLIAQAVALNYAPRFKINHTNKEHAGQIYVPAVNWALFAGASLLVVSFRSSTALASAYGLAESGVMLSTSLSMLAISRGRWNWSLARSILSFGPFVLIDLSFLVSNSLKFFEGGYVPVAIGLGIFVTMRTWNWGRTMIANAYESYSEGKKISSLVTLKQKLEAGNGIVNDERGQFVESSRAVIFLSPQPVKSPDDNVPAIVRTYMRNYGTIPKYSVFLNIAETKHPIVRGDRYDITDFGHNIFAVKAKFGFVEDVKFSGIIDDLCERLEFLEQGKYMVEAAIEELRINREGTSAFTRMKIKFYRRLQRIASPTYRYFGLEAKDALSTDTIPMIMSDAGTIISLPDLDLA